MLSSQLGRVILGGATALPDEMNASPDHDGDFGPLDALLDEIAAAVGKGDDRRPVDRSRSD